MSVPRVSVILPVHNQADHLESVLSEYHRALGAVLQDVEYLLVLNGCRDESASVAGRLTATIPGVRVLESGRASWGRAVRSGLAAATGDLVCYTNLARTTASDLSLLVLYAVTNPGVVVKANRRIRERLVRRLGSLLYNLQCRALFDLSCWDINGTPKVFPRTFTPLMTLTREDDLIDLEFVTRCRAEAYRLIEVPIFSSKRHGARSTTGFGSAFRLYVGAFELWRRRSHADG